MNTFTLILLFIGKILLIILIILIALLLLILLVPVRYQLRCEKAGAAVEASACAAWLLRAVQIRFLIRKNQSDGDRNLDIRLFGFSLTELKKKRKNRKAAARRARRKKQLSIIKEENPERYEELKAEAAERKRAKEEERKRSLESANCERSDIGAENLTDSEPPAKDEGRGADYLIRKWLVRILVKGKSFLRKPVRFLKKTAGKVIFRADQLIENISKKIKSLLTRISDIYVLISKYAAFLSDERTKMAFRKLLKLLRALLLHIKPKVLEGNAVIGFDDPALTGEVAGFAYAFSGVLGGSVKIAPDFQEKHLDGRIYAGGRVILGRLVLLVLAGVLDRNVRYVIGYIKNNT